MPASIFNGVAVKLLKNILKFKGGATIDASSAGTSVVTLPNKSIIVAGISDLSSIPKAILPKDVLAIPIPGLPATSNTWHANAIECMYVSGPGNRVYKCLLVIDSENRAAGLVEKITTEKGRLVSIIEVDGAYASKLPPIGSELYLSVPGTLKDCA